MTTSGSSGAPKAPPKPRELRESALHLVIYSVLLLGYFLVVLRYLTGWFSGLFHHHRVEYAFAGIILMIVQAVALDSISGLILRLIRGKPRS